MATQQSKYVHKYVLSAYYVQQAFIKCLLWVIALIKQTKIKIKIPAFRKLTFERGHLSKEKYIICWMMVDKWRGVGLMEIWTISVPGRGESKCKGPAAGLCLAPLRTASPVRGRMREMRSGSCRTCGYGEDFAFYPG